MMAVRDNHPDVVKLLIDRGAQVNVQTRTGPTPNWILPNSVPGFGHGIGIVRGGLPDRGSRFLIPGALTPLLYAARDGRIESAKILLAAGADIEHADANGITPLLMAITNDHVEMARYLIDQGANVKVVDWYGRTPLWAADRDPQHGRRQLDVRERRRSRAGARADQGHARQRRRRQRPNEGNAADSPADAARHGRPVVGRLHRSDAVSESRAGCGSRRHAAAARARRGSENSDIGRHDGA